LHEVVSFFEIHTKGKIMRNCSSMLSLSGTATLLLVSGFFAPAAAEPIRVDSGFIRVQADHYVWINLNNDRSIFDSDGEIADPDFGEGDVVMVTGPVRARPAPGGTLNLSSHLTSIGGWLHPIPRYTLDFMFDAGTVQISSGADGLPLHGLAPVPFSFLGGITLFDPDTGAARRREVTGRGLATLESADPFFGSTHFSYQFQPPAPVPEPGTLFLVATGAGAVARRRLTRRHSRIPTA
jgi:hypothetical protein